MMRGELGSVGAWCCSRYLGGMVPHRLQNKFSKATAHDDDADASRAELRKQVAYGRRRLRSPVETVRNRHRHTSMTYWR